MRPSSGLPRQERVRASRLTRPRVSWTRRVFGMPLTLGTAGYYSRQNWVFNQHVDGWAGMTDWNIPLSQRVSLSGEFYRGRAHRSAWVGGLVEAYCSAAIPTEQVTAAELGGRMVAIEIQGDQQA